MFSMLFANKENRALQPEWSELITKIRKNPQYLNGYPKLRSIQLEVGDIATFTEASIDQFIIAVRDSNLSKISLQIFAPTSIKSKSMQYFIEKIGTVTEKIAQHHEQCEIPLTTSAHC